MVSPVLEEQLREQMEHLPAGQQRQVLEYARALASSRPRGVAGSDLLPLAGTISVPDLEAIALAIEGCERADAHGW